MAQEGGLQRGQGAAIGEGFHRFDGAAIGLAHRHQTGADLLAIEQHGAGAAIAGVAADFGAGEAELVAQEIRQAQHGIAGPEQVGAVDGEFDHARPATARRTSSSAAWRR